MQSCDRAGCGAVAGAADADADADAEAAARRALGWPVANEEPLDAGRQQRRVHALGPGFVSADRAGRGAGVRTQLQGRWLRWRDLLSLLPRRVEQSQASEREC